MIRVWCSVTADKKGFLAYLKDTYPKKAILVSDLRNLYGAVVMNYLSVADALTGALKAPEAQIRAAIDTMIEKLPQDIVLFDDWFDDGAPSADIIVVHSDIDSDALLRLSTDNEHRVKELTRLRDLRGHIRREKKEVITLKYDETVRDLFEIDDSIPSVIRLKFVKPDPSRGEASDTERTNGEELLRIYKP